MDFDQGGTPQHWVNQYQGPSIGWVRVPQRNVRTIGVAGTYTIDLGINNVEVNVAGSVTLTLPPVGLGTNVGVTFPGRSANIPITISDTGGNAQAFPITIKPNAGDNIMGLGQLQITSNFGAYTLIPQPDAAATWTAK
jgi:hypothetical protein